LPPPPDNQFIIMGDIFVLSSYALSSHLLNNFVVQSVFETSDSVRDAVNKLDPLGEIVQTQVPVWIDVQQTEVTDHILKLNAHHSLMNHWGPLFSTTGASCVALCSCWLFAGWLHQAFLSQNSMDCETSQALQKTVETWLTAAIMLAVLAVGSNSIVTHIPLLQMFLGVSVASDSTVFTLTKADSMYIIDSFTVLLCWRFLANVMMRFL